MNSIHRKIKVLIVDDSKFMQQFLCEILISDSQITVVGFANDPYEARDLIKTLDPDVLTLDIMMPKMDGITFFKNLMRLHPMPVVMVSSLNKKNCAIAIDIIAEGAIDFIPKPTLKESHNLTLYAEELIKAIKNASQATIKTKISAVTPEQYSFANITAMLSNSDLLRNELIAIGASTGGIEALEYILTQLPKIFPPIMIVQHLRKEFTESFCSRLSKLCSISIENAQHNEKILPGHVYVAASDKHLLVKKNQSGYYCFLEDTPDIDGYRPSINALFSSVAKFAGPYSIGVLLTGMGTDGAEGLNKIKHAGGITIVQDKETSVVWGMPHAAILLNAADYVVPLQNIPKKILHVLDIKARRF
jgi:two-component system chemotaxis response regulator CheB